MWSWLAAPVQGSELPAPEYNHFLSQSAVALDPRADRRWIDGGDGTRRIARPERPSFFINDLGRMEPEDRPRGDADSVARNSAENQRAGRHAWSVDNDTLARAPDLREEVQVVADCAAWARQNTHIGQRRRKSGEAHGNSKQETAHGDSHQTLRPLHQLRWATGLGTLSRELESHP